MAPGLTAPQPTSLKPDTTALMVLKTLEDSGPEENLPGFYGS